MHLIYYGFLSHLVGDFVIQTDWMARGKKNNALICLTHVTTYMLPFLPMLLFGLPAWKLAAIALQHFLQDYWEFPVWFMLNTGKAEFAKPPLAPWSIILTDNIFHLVFISLVLAV